MDLEEIKACIAQMNASNARAQEIIDEGNRAINTKQEIDAKLQEIAKIVESTMLGSITPKQVPFDTFQVPQLDETSEVKVPTEGKVFTEADLETFVRDTSFMTIECGDPALVNDPVLKAWGYVSTDGISVIRREDSNYDSFMSRVVEVTKRKIVSQDVYVWVNELDESFMDHDGVLCQMEKIDDKAHWVKNQLETTKKGFFSGSVVSINRIKQMPGTIFQHDIWQRNSVIHIARIGAFNNSRALASINDFLKTKKTNLALNSYSQEQKKMLDRGEHIAPADKRYKLTREGMWNDADLLSYLKEKLKCNSSTVVNSTIKWLLDGHGILSKRGSEWRIQIEDYAHHHEKYDLKKPLKNPFEGKGGIRPSPYKKRFRFQLPDMVHEKGLSPLNIDVEETIKAFKKAGKIVIVK